MRIAVLTTARHRLGGIETYLAAVLPELAAAGHELLFWCEHEEPEGRPLLPLPEATAVCCAATQGREAALRDLFAWAPDVLFSQGLSDPGLEAVCQGAGAGVVLAHNYYGTCISGTKAHQFPTPCPCRRTFGPGCLLQYYPRRCGGWSPVTLRRLYRRETLRLRMLRNYAGIITLASHMREEYLSHGWPPERVWHLPCSLGPATQALPLSHPGLPARGESWRLLFLGRMEPLKGGDVLLEALPQLPRRLGRPVHLTLAGEGRERERWAARARLLCDATPGLAVESVGWVEASRMPALFARSHLLVVPSVWPEPFGLVGLEAAAYGVPAAAFAVGGIPDWLEEGVNGHLAPGDPPTAAGLADALVQCLGDPAHYARLRRGATARAAASGGVADHASAVADVLAQVTRPALAPGVPVP